jgi:hypothetical protein
MLSNDLSSLIQLFNKALPLFEQDHEIILLEIDKSKINLQDGILISFDSKRLILNALFIYSYHVSAGPVQGVVYSLGFHPFPLGSL